MFQRFVRRSIPSINAFRRPIRTAALGLLVAILAACQAPAAAAPTVPPAKAATALAAPTVQPSRTAALAAAVASEAATAGGATEVPDPVVLAAGDIASCGEHGTEATAAIIEAQPGSVLALGDIAYPDGSAQNLADCYAPTWGRFKDRTYAVPGNHDYVTYGAHAYYDYFGPAAGPAGLGYYSFDLGRWHLIALNSNCGAVDCAAGSAQEVWLRADLAAHPAACTLAFWHHPRFNAGLHGNDEQVQALWQALYEGGADLVLNGHDHDYQRFAPQDPTGAEDPARGIREFIVGTGGASRYTVKPGFPNLEAYTDANYGVLRLVLHPAGYDWQFLTEPGQSYTDSGSAACH
jgi:3',5'-cyclic AMP phosphodiesterase CpdA